MNASLSAKLIAIALLAIPVAAPAAHNVAAQHAHAGGGGGGGGSSSNPIPHNDASASAQLLLDMARAQRQAALALADLRRQFDRSPEYQQALTDAAGARLAFDRARFDALAALRSSPEYATAQLGIYQAQKDLETARAGAAQAGSQVYAYATDLLNRRMAISKMEADALAGATQLDDLRTTMIDAQAKVLDLRRTFADSIKSDPAWLAARAQVDQVRSRIPRISG